MSLNLSDQYQVALNSITTGDLDLMEKVLLAPSAVTPDELQTFAQQMGLQRSFLSAAVNFVTDPTVLVALLLSRYQPTAQYIKGTVPHRFIGSANQFSQLSLATRTVEGFFRGTNIPKLIGLKMRREAEVRAIGNRIFERTLIRPNWTREKPVVSLLLEGQNPPGATPELRMLADGIRRDMDELWGFLGKSWQVEEGRLAGERITRSSAAPYAPSRAPRYLRDYLPHIPLHTTESVMTYSGRDAMVKLNRSRRTQAMQMTGQNPDAVWRRQPDGSLQSEWGAYQRFMDSVGTKVFSPRLFQRKRLGIPLQSHEGQGLFITDLDIILQKYVSSVARTYALNAPLSVQERSLARSFIEGPDGAVRAIYPSEQPIAVQILNEGLEASGPLRVLRKRVRGTNRVVEEIDPTSLNKPTLYALRTLMRGVMGRADETDIMVGSLFNSVRRRVSESVGLGKGDADRVQDAISILEQRSKDQQTSNAITSYLYATTIGLNPSSALKNLFQPLLTTMPSIGIGPTLAGYRQLSARLPIYVDNFKLRLRTTRANPSLRLLERVTLAQEQAFIETFPELARANIRFDPRAYELSEAALFETPAGDLKFRRADEMFRVLLTPFTQTEMANQVVTFYGGRRALQNHIRRGLLEPPTTPEGAPLAGRAFEDYLDFEAANMVGSLQFRPGPGSRSVLQSILPAPLRMFTGFPTRLANHFADSTVRGAMLDSQLQGSGLLRSVPFLARNYGTLARTYLMGRAVTDGLRETVGVDISDAMGLTGPFTGIVQSGQIFNPLAVSPLPNLLYGIASFTSTRDIKDLQPLELPGVGYVPLPKLLVPGGIQLSRVAKVLRTYRPDAGGFVDEEERLMFRGDAWDAFLALSGVPLDKERRMRESLDRIQANRLRVRQYRRRFAVAKRNGDINEADRMQTLFSREFPEIGILAVSDHDLRRYEEQARITSVQRLLRTLGKDFGFVEQGLYVTDPDLVGDVPVLLP